MAGELWFMAVFSNFYKSSFSNPATFIEITVFTMADSDLKGSGRVLPDVVIKGCPLLPPKKRISWPCRTHCLAKNKGGLPRSANVNPLSPYIHLQSPQTDLRTLYITPKNRWREFEISNHFPSGDYFINSSILFP